MNEPIVLVPLTQEQRWNMANDMLFKLWMVTAEFQNANQADRLAGNNQNSMALATELEIENVELEKISEFFSNTIFLSFISFMQTQPLNFNNQDELFAAFGKFAKNIDLQEKLILIFGNIAKKFDINKHKGNLFHKNILTGQPLGCLKNKKYSRDFGRVYIGDYNLHCIAWKTYIKDKSIPENIIDVMGDAINVLFEGAQIDDFGDLREAKHKEALTDWILSISSEKADEFINNTDNAIKSLIKSLHESEVDAETQKQLINILTYMRAVKTMQTKIVDPLRQRFEEAHGFPFGASYLFTLELDAAILNEPNKYSELMQALNNKELGRFCENHDNNGNGENKECLKLLRAFCLHEPEKFVRLTQLAKFEGTTNPFLNPKEKSDKVKLENFYFDAVKYLAQSALHQNIRNELTSKISDDGKSETQALKKLLALDYFKDENGLPNFISSANNKYNHEMRALMLMYQYDPKRFIDEVNQFVCTATFNIDFINIIYLLLPSNFGIDSKTCKKIFLALNKYSDKQIKDLHSFLMLFLNKFSTNEEKMQALDLISNHEEIFFDENTPFSIRIQSMIAIHQHKKSTNKPLSLSLNDFKNITQNAKTSDETLVAIAMYQHTNPFNKRSFMKKLSSEDLNALLDVAKKFQMIYNNAENKNAQGNKIKISIVVAIDVVAKVAYESSPLIYHSGWFAQNKDTLLETLSKNYNLKSKKVFKIVRHDSDQNEQKNADIVVLQDGSYLFQNWESPSTNINKFINDRVELAAKLFAISKKYGFGSNLETVSQYAKKMAAFVQDAPMNISTLQLFDMFRAIYPNYKTIDLLQKEVDNTAPCINGMVQGGFIRTQYKLSEITSIRSERDDIENAIKWIEENFGEYIENKDSQEPKLNSKFYMQIPRKFNTSGFNILENCEEHIRPVNETINQLKKNLITVNEENRHALQNELSEAEKIKSFLMSCRNVLIPEASFYLPTKPMPDRTHVCNIMTLVEQKCQSNERSFLSDKDFSNMENLINRLNANTANKISNILLNNKDIVVAAEYVYHVLNQTKLENNINGIMKTFVDKSNPPIADDNVKQAVLNMTAAEFVELYRNVKRCMFDACVVGGVKIPENLAKSIANIEYDIDEKFNETINDNRNFGDFYNNRVSQGLIEKFGERLNEITVKDKTGPVILQNLNNKMGSLNEYQDALFKIFECNNTPVITYFLSAADSCKYPLNLTRTINVVMSFVETSKQSEISAKDVELTAEIATKGLIPHKSMKYLVESPGLVQSLNKFGSETIVAFNSNPELFSQVYNIARDENKQNQIDVLLGGGHDRNVLAMALAAAQARINSLHAAAANAQDRAQGQPDHLEIGAANASRLVDSPR